MAECEHVPWRSFLHEGSPKPSPALVSRPGGRRKPTRCPSRLERSWSVTSDTRTSTGLWPRQGPKASAAGTRRFGGEQMKRSWTVGVVVLTTGALAVSASPALASTHPSASELPQHNLVARSRASMITSPHIRVTSVSASRRPQKLPVSAAAAWFAGETRIIGTVCRKASGSAAGICTSHQQNHESSFSSQRTVDRYQAPPCPP